MGKCMIKLVLACMITALLLRMQHIVEYVPPVQVDHSPKVIV